MIVGNFPDDKFDDFPPFDRRYHPIMLIYLGRTKDYFRYVADVMREMVRSDVLDLIVRDIPSEVPPCLPDEVIENGCRHSGGRLSKEEMRSIMDTPNFRWCHHAREYGYFVARLIATEYIDLIRKGMRLVPEPWYLNFKADLGIVDENDNCIVAVEIGDVSPVKLPSPLGEGGPKDFCYFRFVADEFWKTHYVVIRKGRNGERFVKGWRTEKLRELEKMEEELAKYAVI